MPDGEAQAGRDSGKKRWWYHHLAPLKVALNACLATLIAIAVNAATGNPADLPPFPGPLRLIQQHPWLAVGILTVLAGIVGWGQLQWTWTGTTRPATGNRFTVLTPIRAAVPTQADEARTRHELLAQVRRIWIDGILDRSLAEMTQIALGLVERPEAVAHPWGALLRRPDELGEVLPPGVRMSQVAGRFDFHVLILGAPGAGKTTLLLEYARDLLEEAARDVDAPIPVVFHLSAWSDEQLPLAAWLAAELRFRYGVPRRLAPDLVDQERLAVLLDGLDEVPVQRRAACIQQINRFRGEHGRVPLVIAARTRVFHDLPANLMLSLNGAVEVQPLEPAQVRRWLEAAGRPLAGLRSVLRDRRHWLWDLLDNPLLLSVTALTYKDQPAQMIRADGSIDLLLSSYVDTMLTRPHAPLASQQEQTSYERDDTVRWLAWLAERMGPESVFYPDWMQPDWLPTRRQQWLTTTGFGLAVAMIGALAGAPGGGLVGALVGGLSAGLLVGLAAGLTRRGSTIVPVEQPRWSWAQMRGGMVRGLLVGVAVGLLVGVLIGLPADLGAGLLVGLAAGLATGLWSMLLEGFSAPPSLQPAAPYEGIRAAGRAARGGALALGLTVGPIVGLAAGLEGGPAVGLYVGGLSGGLSGLCGGLICGGDSYLRHQLLTALLRRDGLIPANLLDFLNYAESRILLRRAGGGYLFIHRLLQDYFARQSCGHVPSQ